jgi:hypothetical protein
MSQNIFNLYSATIFAEHPVALWNLDDDFSYLSLIDVNHEWTIEGGTSSSVQFEPTTSPFESVGVGDVNLSLENFQANQNQMIASLESFSVPDDIDIYKRTANVSTYIYGYESNVSKYRIGVRFRNSPSDPWTYDVSEYLNPEKNQWKKLSHTFKVVNFSLIYEFDENDVDPFLFPIIERDYHPVLIVDFEDTEGVVSLYNFSTGQWSEQYNFESPGVTPVAFSGLSSSSSFVNMLQISVNDVPFISTSQIDPYGFSNSDTGYYFCYKNKPLATNSKLPMVFGSGNITEIYGNDIGLPSLAFPGKGFLNESGKYKELTAEFWLRINPQNSTEHKIFGAVGSEDGLYVDKENIILKVGHRKKKYFVGKWYRPMLLDIRYNPLFISVLINGDVVMSTDINPADTEFPDNSSYDEDWIGFFGNEEIPQFEVDCLAIYPYIVPEQVAKRRFVYGQGVGKSEEIAKRFSGTSLGIDFPFAEYTHNLIYPDMSKWDSGFYSNINANSRFISLPEYTLPEIRYVGDDLQPFQLARVRRSWLGIKENGSWENWRAGVWRAISQTKEANTLVDNYDSQSESTGNYYIKLTPNSVYEDLFGSIDFSSLAQISENVASTITLFSINRGELLDIQNTSEKLTLLRFSNRATGDFIDISINIENEGDETIDYFYNNILLDRQDFTIEPSDKYFAVGFDFDKFTATYSSIIKNFFSIPQNISLSVAGQDRNEFPGKIFKVIFNNRLFTNKDLGDYFKSDGTVKCDCFETPNYFENLLAYTGNYTLVFDKANSSMIMDIAAVGYWEDSVPLSQFGTFIKDKSGNASYYDLDALQFNLDYPTSIYAQDSFDEDSMVNAFITVQRFQDVGGINYSSYTVTKDLDEKKYIDLDDPQVNLDTTKFRVVDGTIIFPPRSKVDFKDAYITIHLEIKSSGTNSSPTRLQRMSLSSIAFDQSTFYELGTPTGNKFYPFTRQGPSYTNKVKNPFAIYKDSTPYLYLTADSGISSMPYAELESSNTTNFARGLSVAINSQKQESYLIYGLSFWVAYNKSNRIDERRKLFSIYSVDQQTNFYINPELAKFRGKLEALRYEISGEEEDTNVEIYQNGVETEAYMYPMSWSFITIKFDEPMEFDESIGQLEFYPGIIFNNVTLYTQSIDTKVDDIFESYLGLSNVVAQDSSTLGINSDGLDLFTDIRWSNFSGKPV